MSSGLHSVHSTLAELRGRLPLPLARIARRAGHAKTPLERHLAAYHLWEAGVKLVTSVALVEYANLGRPREELRESLESLSKPMTGDWWRMLRELSTVLAEEGQAPFQKLHTFLLGESHSDLPLAAGLLSRLRTTLDPQRGRQAQATVSIRELFDRMVEYRNKEIAHGVIEVRDNDHHDELARLLMSGIGSVLGRMDVLAGGRLIVVTNVSRAPSGAWRVERAELMGEDPLPLDPLEVFETQTARLPETQKLYHCPAGLSLSDRGGLERNRQLYPLLIYDVDCTDVCFLDVTRRGKGKSKVVFLSYSSGERPHENLLHEQCELLQRLLGESVAEGDVRQWADRQHDDATPAPETESTAGREPRCIGEFELISRIGEGGMGEVFRAWQPSLKRQVALKRLIKFHNPEAQRRFKQEVLAAARLKHKNVVEVYQYGAEGDHIFYTMELLPGADLARVWKKASEAALSSDDTGRPKLDVDATSWHRALSTAIGEARDTEQKNRLGDTAQLEWSELRPPSEVESLAPELAGAMERKGSEAYIVRVVDLCRQVAEGLDALHHAGIVHRDVSPGNIIVTPTGRAVLTDLGVALLTGPDAEGTITGTRDFVGNKRYCSPEQFGAAHHVDHRTDVYSLGATLWELLTLRPFRGITRETPPAEQVKAITERPPEPVRKYAPHVPKDLEAVVMKCVETHASNRYASARELAQELERWLRGDVLLVRPPSIAAMMRRRLRRRWREAAVTIGGILLLVLAGVSILSNRVIQRLEDARQETERQRVEAMRLAEAETQAKQQALSARDAEARAREQATAALDIAQLAAEAEQRAKDEALRAAALENEARNDAEIQKRAAANFASELTRIKAAQLLDQGDWSGALQWFRQTADWEWQRDPHSGRSEAYRRLVSNGLQQLPPLLQVWKVGQAVRDLAISEEGRVLIVKAGVPDDQSIEELGSLAFLDGRPAPTPLAPADLQRFREQLATAAGRAGVGKVQAESAATTTPVELAGAPREPIPVPGDILWGVQSPDGLTLVTSTRDQLATIWRVARGQGVDPGNNPKPQKTAASDPPPTTEKPAIRGVESAALPNRAPETSVSVAGLRLDKVSDDGDLENVTGAVFSQDGRHLVTWGSKLVFWRMKATGNTFDSAATLPDGIVDLQGTLDGKSEQDTWKFVAPLTGLVTAELESIEKGSLDPILTVHEEDAQNAEPRKLAENDDAESGLNSRLEFAIVQGRTYYVIAGAHNGSGNYRLRMRSRPALLGGDQEHPTPIPPGQMRVDETFLAAEESHAYLFRAPRSGLLTIDLHAVEVGLDPSLKVFSRDAQLLAFNDDAESSFRNSRVDLMVQQDQELVLLSSSYAGSGAAVLLLSYAKPADSESSAPPAAANATPAFVEFPTAQGHVVGRLDSSSERDFYRFTPDTDQPIQFDLLALGNDGLDCALIVFNQRGERVAYNDDRHSRTLDSRLIEALTPGEPYIVEVTSGSTLDAKSRGRYLLRTIANSPLRLASNKRPEPLRWREQSTNPQATHGVVISPDGQRMLTLHANGQPLIWDLNQAALQHTLDHRNALAGAFSADGRLLATAGPDGVRTWDAKLGVPLTPLLGYAAGATAVQFDSSGRCLVTAGADGEVLVWDLQTAEPDRLPSSLVVVDTAKLYVSPHAQLIARQGEDEIVRVEDSAGRPVTQFRLDPLDDHAEGESTSGSPSGGLTIATDSLAATSLLREYNPFNSLTANESRIWYSPDGRHMACRESIDALSILGEREGQRQRVQLALPNGNIEGLCWSGQPCKVAALFQNREQEGTPGEIWIWDWSLPQPTIAVVPGRAVIDALALDDSGERLAVVCGEAVEVWSLTGDAPRRIAQTPAAHGFQAISRVQFAGDATRLAFLTADSDSSTTTDGLFATGRATAPSRLWCWNWETAALTSITNGIEDLCFVPAEGGEQLLTWSTPGTVQWWSQNGEPLRRIELAQPGQRLTALRFGPQGESCVTWIGERITHWDLRTGEPRRLPMLAPGKISSAGVDAEGGVWAECDPVRFVRWSWDRQLVESDELAEQITRYDGRKVDELAIELTGARQRAPGGEVAGAAPHWRTGWHVRQFEISVADEELDAARLHLDQLSLLDDEHRAILESRLLEHRDRRDEALARLRDALTRVPNSPALNYRRALELHWSTAPASDQEPQEKLIAEARDALRICLESTPDDLSYRRWATATAEWAGSTSELEQALSQWLDHCPGDRQLLRRRAQARRRMENWAGAIADAVSYCENNPGFNRLNWTVPEPFHEGLARHVDAADPCVRCWAARTLLMSQTAESIARRSEQQLALLATASLPTVRRLALSTLLDTQLSISDGTRASAMQLILASPDRVLRRTGIDQLKGQSVPPAATSRLALQLIRGGQLDAEHLTDLLELLVSQPMMDAPDAAVTLTVADADALLPALNQSGRRTLLQLLLAQSGDPPEIGERILALTPDADAATISSVLEAFTTDRWRVPSESLQTVVTQLGRSTDWHIREELAKQLPRLRLDERAVVRLLGQLRFDDDVDVRNAAAAGLKMVNLRANRDELVAVLREGLHSRDVDVRLRVLQAAANLGAEVTPLADDIIARLLDADEASNIQDWSAYVLGEIDSRTLDTFAALDLALNTHREPLVRLEAAGSLIKLLGRESTLPTGATPARKLAEIVVAASRSTDENLRIEGRRIFDAVNPRGQCQEWQNQWVDEVPALSALLADRDAAVRTSAAKLLGRLGPLASPAAESLSARLALDAEMDVDVRLALLDSLEKVRGRGARETFDLVRQSDPSLKVKVAAIRAGRRSTTSRSLARPIMQTLAAALAEEDDATRTAAIGAAAEFGLAAGSLSSSLLHHLTATDSSAELRRAAANGLVEIAPPEGVLRKLGDVLGQRSIVDTEAQLLAAWAHLRWSGQSEPALSVLAEGLSSTDDAVRLQAIKLLVRAGPAALPMLPRMIEAMEDSDPKNREWIADALGKMGAAAQSAIPALVANLRHPDASVREWSAYGIGKILPPVDPVVLNALAECLDDQSTRRTSVLQEVLKAIGSHGPPAAGLAGRLLGLLKDESAEVRQAAVSALVKVAPATLISTCTAQLSGDGDREEWLAARGMAHAALREWPAAEEDLREAATLNPQSAVTHSALLSVRLASGDRARAIATITSMLAAADRSAERSTGLNTLYVCVLCPQLAEGPVLMERAEELIGIDPADADVDRGWGFLGALQYRSGQFADALQTLRTTTRLQTGRTPPSTAAQDYLFLALTHARQGDQDAAHVAWQRAQTFKSQISGDRRWIIDWETQVWLDLLEREYADALASSSAR